MGTAGRERGRERGRGGGGGRSCREGGKTAILLRRCSHFFTRTLSRFVIGGLQRRKWSRRAARSLGAAGGESRLVQRRVFITSSLSPYLVRDTLQSPHAERNMTIGEVWAASPQLTAFSAAAPQTVI